MPVFLAVEAGVVDRVGAVLRRFNIAFDRVLIVSGGGVTKGVADRVTAGLAGTDVHRVVIESNAEARVEDCNTAVRLTRSQAILAVGGGRVLDVAKLAGHETGVPVVTLPTTLAHDGMSSPVAVVRAGTRARSIGVRVPLAVCVDLDVVRSAPIESLLAGVGDLLSNISACLDWELAEQHGADRVEQVSRVVAKASAEGFLHTLLHDLSRTTAERAALRPCTWEPAHYRALADGLLCSGVAMAIAGSSRPCSGAEHLISHALDRLAPEPAPHGLQVGVATLFTLSLHGAPLAPIRHVLEGIGFPVDPEALGFDRDLFLHAVERAPEQRPGRYSILNCTSSSQWEAAYAAAYSPSPRPS